MHIYVRVLTMSCIWILISSPANGEDRFRLFFEDGFEQGSDNWQMTDPDAWRVQSDQGSNVLSLYKDSNYFPPHRSPHNIALINNISVGDFTLTARVRSTIQPYNHQDVTLFFGYQDPANFYYAHLGKTTDDRANQIFIVDDAPRTKISSFTNDGIPWDAEWHDVKVERTISDGTISIFFDDMQIPVMQATDTTFTRGTVGIGSFDDTADWDNVRLSIPIADIDMDGDTDSDDLDRLYLELGGGDTTFDLNGDGLVDSLDVESWRTAAGSELGFSAPIQRGDANLDGKVDSADLNQIALNWQITDAMSWGQGDFNQDRIVDANDLNDLALNWRDDITHPMAASVPEPSVSLWSIALAAVLLTARTTSERLHRS